MNILAAITIPGKIIFLRTTFIYVFFFFPSEKTLEIWPTLSDMQSLAEK